MANNLQDSLLKAVDVIVNKRIEDIALDKTIVASIERCVDASKGIYRVQYQGGSILAYAREGASYTPKTSVYVSVPQNDFSQKKWIVGRTSQVTEDDNITAVSSTLANYQVVGSNVVSVKNKDLLKKGLISYTILPEEDPLRDVYDDYIVLYDYDNRGKNVININQTAFQEYMKESSALMIEANFRTSLTEEQQLQNNAEYGLGFTLVFEQGDATYNTMQEKYNALAHTIGIIKMKADGSTYKVTLKTYNEDGLTWIENGEEKVIIQSFKSILDNNLFWQRFAEQTVDGNTTLVSYDPLRLFLDDLEAYRFQVKLKYSNDEYDFVNQYYNLILDLITKRNDLLEEYGGEQDQDFVPEDHLDKLDPQKEYMAWFASNVNTRKEKTSYYVLDSGDMVGVPFNYPTPTEQYTILPIDTGKFVRVQNVFFYCKGFIQDEGKALYVEKYKGGDIFVSDIEFYALKELDAISGDYRLTYSTANGTVFYEESSQINEETGELEPVPAYPDVIPIRAKLTYKVHQDLSANATYYWFKKDGRVNVSHENYSQYGGAGWYYMKDKGNGREITITREEATAYENVYKCVCSYNELTRLATQITVYNNENKREIKITSDRGTDFTFDSGTPLLTCSVNDRTDFTLTKEEEENNIIAYKFVWNRIDQDGTVINLDKSGDEANQAYELEKEAYFQYITDINADTSLSEEDRQKALDANPHYDSMIFLKSSAEELNGVSFDGPNKLLYPIYKVKMDTFASFECHVYMEREAYGEDGNPILNEDGSQKHEEVYYGSAIITLQNATGSYVGSHYIVIENGDQVFQYNEYGVSPASDRYLNPQKPANLICHLYNPAGVEVPNSDYNVVWTYPLSNTLIIAPNKEEMKQNPVTELYEWYTAGHTAPVVIAENYNYSCVRNQIKCEAHYANMVISKDTEFYFGKVGDNGSNGTDVIAKIDPADLTTSILDTEALALVTVGGDRPGAVWSCPELFTATDGPALELKLYHRGKYINPIEANESAGEQQSTWRRVYKNVKWDVAGGKNFRRWITATKHTEKDEEGNVTSETPWLGVVDFNQDENGSIDYPSRYTGFLIRAQASLDIQQDQEYGENSSLASVDPNQLYNAFYPICWVDYTSKEAQEKFRVGVDSNFYLKQIMYNADGRNPSYNKSQGVGFIVTDLGSGTQITDEERCTYSWQAKGGLILEKNPNGSGKIAYEDTPSFNLYYERDGNDPLQHLCTNENRDLVENGNVLIYEGTLLTAEEMSDTIPPRVYIKPEDTYTGAAQNNHVFGTVSVDGEEIAKIIIPIYMCLNRYGLTSLNAWDGNTVEIDEEEGYILAPQIGAGMKTVDENGGYGNLFTGIVMGVFDTFDPETKNEQINKHFEDLTNSQNEYSGLMYEKEAENLYYPRVGLTGFSNGIQSIFMNAKTGSVVLGLPEDQAQQDNPNLEGQIALVPGGTSKIGSWRIGSQILYSMSLPSDEWEGTDAGKVVYPNITPYAEYDPTPPTFSKFKNYPIRNAKVTVPPFAQGAILSSDPAYLTIKGAPLYNGDVLDINGNPTGEERKNCDIDFTSINTAIMPGDSFEVEIDTQKESIFSIYRVTPSYEEDANGNKTVNGLWRRYPLVGINVEGQFYSNAVENSETAMAIGMIGAFGKRAAERAYVGGKFSWGDPSDRTKSNLFKFFTDFNEEGPGVFTNATTYLSTSDEVNNEYEKNLNLYGKTLNLYAGYGTGKTSSYSVEISSSQVGMYHGSSHLYVDGSIYGNGTNTFFTNTGTFQVEQPSLISLKATDTGTAVLSAGSSITVNSSGVRIANKLAVGSTGFPGTNGITVEGGIKTWHDFYWSTIDNTGVGGANQPTFGINGKYVKMANSESDAENNSLSVLSFCNKLTRVVDEVFQDFADTYNNHTHNVTINGDTIASSVTSASVTITFYDEEGNNPDPRTYTVTRGGSGNSLNSVTATSINVNTAKPNQKL